MTLEAVESVLLVKVRKHFCNISLVCLRYENRNVAQRHLDMCYDTKYLGGLNRIFEAFVI